MPFTTLWTASGVRENVRASNCLQVNFSFIFFLRGFLFSAILFFAFSIGLEMTGISDDNIEGVCINIKQFRIWLCVSLSMYWIW